MNNPTYKLDTVAVNRLAINLLENGSSTEATQFVNEIISPIMGKIFFYQNNARMLPNNGHGSDKFIIKTREGWKDDKKPDNYDFLGLKQSKFLSEQVYRDKFLTSEFEYDLKQIRKLPNPVKALYDLLKALITEEFPNLIEKRLSNMINSAIVDGVNDDAGANNVKPLTRTINLKYTITTKADREANGIAITNLGQQLASLWRIDNPILLKPMLAETFTAYVTPEFHQVLIDVGAFEIFGGDSTYAAYIGNKPIGTFQGLPLVKSPYQSKAYPFMLIKNKSYFLDIGEFDSRVDFVGISATNYFFKIDSSYFAYKMSYWNIKFDGMFVWKDGVSDLVNPYIISCNTATGLITYGVKIDGPSNQTYTVELVNNLGSVLKTETTAITKIDYTFTTTETQTVYVNIKLADGTPIEASEYFLATNKGQTIKPLSLEGEITEAKGFSNLPNVNEEAKAIKDAEVIVKEADKITRQNMMASMAIEDPIILDEVDKKVK